MNSSKPFPLLQIAASAIVGLAIAVGVCTWLRLDPSGQRDSRPSKTFDYDLGGYEKIDPALVRYRQAAVIPVAMAEVRGVAADAQDRILVAGDKSVAFFAPDGKRLNEIKLDQGPYCLAVGGGEHAFPGRLYVGMRDHVEVYDTQGKRLAVWDRPGPRAVLTSIALGEEDVFVADAGSLVVWRYDVAGKVIRQIGKRDPSAGIAGFVCPSPYFDVALAPDGLLRITNPGVHRVEAYTTDGHHELSWGKAGGAIGDFCGCCGPSNIALLPDGRVVTAEKGIPRVKVYSPTGEFECVVAGPDILAPDLTAAIETCDEHTRKAVDLAVDGRQRVLVLDPAARCVRIFEHK